jgi:hypothetical protein
MSNYLSGVGRSVIAKVETTYGVAAGTGSAKKKRRTAIKLKKTKARYQSGEIRDDEQKVLSSSGGAKVEGQLDGELSVGTYQDEFEGVLRAVAAAVGNITGVTLTVAGAGPTYTITRSAGDFIAAGLRVGMIFKGTVGLAAGNLNRNLLITTLATGVATVYPLDGAALTAEGPIAACTLVVPGKRIIVPSSGHIERSFTYEDLLSATYSRLAVGVELQSASVDATPGANAKVSFPLLGKDMTRGTAAYFVSPTALGTARPLSGPKGAVLRNGAVVSIITGLNFAVNGNLSTEAVIGSLFSPAVGQGSITGTGQLSQLVLDKTEEDAFDADTPFEILLYLAQDPTDPASAFMAFHLPACQYNDVDFEDGEKLLKQTMPFEFAKKDTATGYDSTTIAIQDSAFV